MTPTPNSTKPRRVSLRILPLVVLAMLLVAAPTATASSQVLRPTTTAMGGGWTATPAGTSLAAALADDVSQPSVPDTASGFITSPSNGNSGAAVAIAAPTLAQGENVTGVTAWAYLATGSTRSAYISLYSNSTLLGWVPVWAGQSARWYALTLPTAPTAAQAASLYLVVSPNGNASTAVKVYAGYVALQTDAPDPTQGPSPDSAPPAESPATGTETASDSAPVDSPLAATLAPATQALTAKQSGVVKVPVRCPAIQVFGCTGTITIELLGSAGNRDKQATSARRRKIALRVKRHFKVAAGAKAIVPVVLNRRTARALRRKGRARARVTVSTELGNGKRAVNERTVTLRERRTVRRASQKSVRGGKGKRH
jgi:hypothetical protein